MLLTTQIKVTIMATDYTIFIGTIEALEITVSTSRTAEDLSQYHAFVESLPKTQKHLVSLVSEYDMHDERDCFGSGDFDPTDCPCDCEDECFCEDDYEEHLNHAEVEMVPATKAELKVLAKFNKFFDIEEEVKEVHDPRENCPCCNTMQELYTFGGFKFKGEMKFTCIPCMSNGKAKAFYKV